MLTSATDRNGNTLEFTMTGISGSGVNIQFERDAKGRITRAIDPAGNSIQYQYDVRGDLVKVIDRDGNVTNFVYKTTPAHYLDQVIDPLGRIGVRAEYGTDGRLGGLVNGSNSLTDFQYNLSASTVTLDQRVGKDLSSSVRSRWQRHRANRPPESYDKDDLRQ